MKMEEKEEEKKEKKDFGSLEFKGASKKLLNGKEQKKEEKDSYVINESLLGEILLPLGLKFIHMPSLLKGFLSLRTENKKYAKNRIKISISNELKNMFLDIVFKEKFKQDDYNKLVDAEQKLFDDTCNYCKFMTHNIAMMNTHSNREKNELMRKFEVMKGEILAGNSSTQLIKDMRNIVLELRSKKYIPKDMYDKLIEDIVACL